jgi:ADP-ribose pyrophosphatase YjhB (NUDIX family)
MSEKDRYCSYCGQAFADDQPWPRTCAACAGITYRNPLPVGILLLAVARGLVAIRRGIEPAKGRLALPGGYIDVGETWQEAMARELFEETGIRTDPHGIREFRVLTSQAHGGLILVFGLARRARLADLPPFVPTDETTERVILLGPEELAFPAHTQVVEEYFGRRRRSPRPRAR